MPQTQGVINGTNFRLYLNGLVIGRANSCTVAYSKEIRETVHKDNTGGYSSGESGKKSYTLSFEGFMSEKGDLGTGNVNAMQQIFALFDQDDAFDWKATTDQEGDSIVSGQVIMSDFSMTAAVEENGTISGSCTGIGAPVFGVVTV
ncbi:phage tail tube protein [Neolewinella antarctica]|uniref:Uncharacterized protein n=1 Tax=Neolewinella antarctica TaxID=442734 RepID=A0ABX0X6W6_9BACT|nr:hypothetical protein [Neolewinella antarctica]NJC24800.1 hypothetical protein [Neolewinella antarctica]